MLIDSHAHLTSLPQGELEAILDRSLRAGVQKIVNISTTPEELKESIMLKKRYPWIHNVAATTPHDVEKESEEIFRFFKERGEEGELVAIGETGLDYHYKHSPIEEQKGALRRYMALAEELKLPLVIHCREAFEDLFKIFDERIFTGKVILHCFTGTLKEAEEGVRRGFYISFSGIVTFKKSHSLREVAQAVPVENLLIETDAPYLAPESHRGESNEPAFIVETGELIASLKGLPFEQFAKIVSATTLQLFKI